MPARPVVEDRKTKLCHHRGTRTADDIRPAFTHCAHEGPCTAENCVCIQTGHFCTKHCRCSCAPAPCKNLFPGCSCKFGRCRTKACPCFAAGRECDPDLCRSCGSCTVLSSTTTTSQRCQNDAISMGRHRRLLLAPSSIPEAGWGLFTKDAIPKGGFIHEYQGECISQEEVRARDAVHTHT